MFGSFQISSCVGLSSATFGSCKETRGVLGSEKLTLPWGLLRCFVQAQLTFWWFILYSDPGKVSNWTSSSYNTEGFGIPNSHLDAWLVQVPPGPGSPWKRTWCF